MHTSSLVLNIDYKEKGTKIKWNPSIKTPADKKALWEALLDDRIDAVATDHAPHTLHEKQNPYLSCPWERLWYNIVFPLCSKWHFNVNLSLQELWKKCVMHRLYFLIFIKEVLYGRVILPISS